jgi:DNA polymerase III subunit tau-like protein
VPAAEAKAIWIGPLLGEARPAALDGNVLTLEFPRTAEFHREKLEEPRNLDLVREALHEVTGRRLSIATTVAELEQESEGEDDEPLAEGDFISLLKDKFDAEEVEDS